MDTFLRLAGIATLVLAGQFTTPEIASAAVESSKPTEFFVNQIISLGASGYSAYTPPDNGNPDGQGGGSR